eukprot:m.172974 g.172974  ORF g.172974 m.172974 type:complete len:180 (+) comp15379_c0_seq11:110-649(+)
MAESERESSSSYKVPPLEHLSNVTILTDELKTVLLTRCVEVQAETEKTITEAKKVIEETENFLEKITSALKHRISTQTEIINRALGNTDEAKKEKAVNKILAEGADLLPPKLYSYIYIDNEPQRMARIETFKQALMSWRVTISQFVISWFNAMLFNDLFVDSGILNIMIMNMLWNCGCK